MKKWFNNYITKRSALGCFSSLLLMGALGSSQSYYRRREHFWLFRLHYHRRECFELVWLHCYQRKRGSFQLYYHRRKHFSYFNMLSLIEALQDILITLLLKEALLANLVMLSWSNTLNRFDRTIVRGSALIIFSHTIIEGSTLVISIMMSLKEPILIIFNYVIVEGSTLNRFDHAINKGRSLNGMLCVISIIFVIKALGHFNCGIIKWSTSCYFNCTVIKDSTLCYFDYVIIEVSTLDCFDHTIIE